MSTSSGRLHAWASCGAVIATSAAVAFAGWRKLGAVDDAYISLRYAANWAAGRGLVFNPGERVEGYTNASWIGLQAVAIRLGADPEAAMQWLGWSGFFAMTWLAGVLFARHVLPRSPGVATLLAVAAALCPVTLAWAASGMESCLYAALVLGALLAALAPPARAPLAAGALLALAALTRLEAVALVPVLAVVVWVAQRSFGASVRFGAVFGGLFGTYFAVRALHFGQLLPNVFYAKLDYGNAALAERGAGYLLDFAAGAAPVAALALVGAALLRGAPLWARACAGVAGMQLAVVLWEGGDHFPLFRFLVPVWIPLVALALHALVRAAARLPEARRPLAVGAAGVAAIVASDVALALRRFPERPDRPGQEARQVSHLERFWEEARLARAWSRVGRALGRAAPQGASLSTVAIGAIGFHSDFTIVDPHGLVFPEIALGGEELGRGYPGHEKFDVERVLAREPDYLLLVNVPSQAPVAEEDLAGEVWGEFNRAVVRHPALARDYEYHSIAFGRRWLNLHVRRGVPVPSPLERDACREPPGSGRQGLRGARGQQAQAHGGPRQRHGQGHAQGR